MSVELVKKYSNAIENMRELQDMGCVVLCGVDATTMSQHFFLTTQRFHRIVYNFPHVGFAYPEANACQIKYVIFADLLSLSVCVCHILIICC